MFSVGYFDSPEQKIIHRIAPTSNRHNGSNSATSGNKINLAFVFWGMDIILSSSPQKIPEKEK